MSYLEPRGGQPTSGDRSSDPDAPEPYAAYWVPDDPATPPPAGAAAVAPGEPPYEDAGVPFSEGLLPAAPAWDPPTAATSTSEAEYELTAGTAAAGGHRSTRSRGRAGRNLPAAIGVGLSLGFTVLASLIFYREAFLGVIAVAVSVGIWETARALRITGARPPLIPLIAGGLLMTGLAWWPGEDAVVLGLVVTVLSALLWRLADRPGRLGREFSAILLVAVYVPFLLSFAILLARPETDGHWRVLCTLIAVILSDTGGYAAGVFFGKHSMAPLISPKKSWEGFAGSITAAAVGSALVVYFTLDVPFYWGALFGAVISVVAVLGDLAESMLKRDLHVKDMSQLLPGHGGLMDRLDSILFAVPTAYLLLTLMAPLS